MAIKFSNSNLQGISYQTYEINKFNGVDYTTTPTNVDDTRAIEISNYVPYGNALRKRDGWKLINGFKNGDVKLNIHDIWKINVPEKEDTYIVYASDISSLDGNFINSGLYIGNMSDNFSSLDTLYDLKVYNSIKPEEIYSQGFYFEGRLFLLVANSYLMIYYDKDNDIIECKQVKDDAFIPTTVIGIGTEGQKSTSSTLQNANLLSDKFKLELINYPYLKTEPNETNLIENAFFTIDFTQQVEPYNTVRVNGYFTSEYMNGNITESLYNIILKFQESNPDLRYYSKIRIEIKFPYKISAKDLTLRFSDIKNGNYSLFKENNGFLFLYNSETTRGHNLSISDTVDLTNVDFECDSLGMVADSKVAFNSICVGASLFYATETEPIYRYSIGSYLDKDNFEIIEINNTKLEKPLRLDSEEVITINGIGEISLSSYSDSGVLLVVTKTMDTDLNYNNPQYITLTIKNTNYASNKTVEKMRFGIPFGSYGYRDRLFLSGNPNMPNVDIHSGETNDLENPWKDYTYFPDTNYATFGTSDTKITGYGMLNNGSMAIFKEFSNGQPNLYFRTYEMITDSDGNMIEYFPITISGLSLENNSLGQIIGYGNDLLVNNSRGIYKIMAGESTATQTYYANEMSYFIRDNLGTDVSDSCHIVYEGKLYVSRKDRFGNKRIYVADENRYSFIDGRQVYEWWVLDGIQADKFWIINDELYFFNEKGLCKFVKDSFIDEYHIDVPNANINGEDFSEYAFIDDQRNHIVLNTASDVFTEIMGSAEITGARDIESAYNILRKNARIKFNGGFYAINKYDNSGISVEHWSSSDLYYIKVPLNSRSDNKYIPHLLQYQYDYNNGNFIYLGIKYNAVEIDYDESHYIITAVKVGEDETFIKDYMAIIYDQCEFEIYDILDSVYNKPLSQCDVEVGQWIWRGKDGTEYFVLGDTNEVYFNKFQLKAIDYENESFMLDFEFIPSNQLRDVTFIIPKAIESYWFSKFNALSRIDYLKTADKITFVADVRNGGDTLVGYRTNKSVVSYDSTAKPFRFDYLDFNDISFGIGEISKTYTAKKKIKNFSFMQLLFIGDKDADSTLVSLSFRYRYTKNNKGVK